MLFAETLVTTRQLCQAIIIIDMLARTEDTAAILLLYICYRPWAMVSSAGNHVVEDLVADLQELLDRLQKRHKIVEAHKQRPDYVSYTSNKSKDERTTSDPITPDTDECMSKRQWESCMCQWRQRLRDVAAVTVVPPSHLSQAN